MNRDTYLRGVTQPQGPARQPAVSSRSRNTSQNAYARVHSFQHQAETQAQEGLDNEHRFEEAEAAVLQEIEVIDLTEEVFTQKASAPPSGLYRFKQVIRNDTLEPTHRQLRVCRFGNTDLKHDTFVELHQPVGNWESRFVEIKSIWVSRSDDSVIIRGLPYTRNRDMRGLLEKKRNEVCQILEIDSDDKRPDEAQALVEISLRDILQVRALKKTNVKYPYNCYGLEPQWSAKTDKEKEEQAPLTFRRRFRVQYKDRRFRKLDKPNDWSFSNLTEAEADDGDFRKSDKELRCEWLGGKIHVGGSFMPQVIHVDGPEVPRTRKDRQYTFADLFCGAGGTSRGAVMAGLKLEFGVDHWDRACETFRRNFPGARVYEMDMFDFIKNSDIDRWLRSHPIDILHLSPPCQEWSPQKYSTAQRVNENNMASLFACPPLVKKIRPRVFTVEQTFGLLHATHAGFFNALVQGFMSLGYSVRWKIVPLVEYGLPQTRKRLIMIGACRGEQLPPWPPATHAEKPTGSQKAYVTEAQAIQGLSRRDRLHNEAQAIIRGYLPRDGNMPLTKTITCSGAQGVSHFSGRRDHTVREIACLQGFPVSHQFEGGRTEIKKQIGNAFPSCVAKAFYSHLRAWLQQVDGVQRAAPAQLEAHRSSAPAPAPRLARQMDESRSPSAAVILPSIEEDHQDSPMSTVGPMLERMSLAPSDPRDESPLENRSRSHTLGRSASPASSASHRAEQGSQKRDLDSMHDGETDEVMKEESPPKRERVVDGGDHDRSVVVHDRKIPSRLPRYAGPPRPYDASGEDMVVGQPDRRNHDGVLKESHTNSWGRWGQRSRHDAVVDDAAPSGSDGDEDVWTFF